MKLHDCWNHIGIWGDGTCAELAQAVHCRNCPVYSSAARDLLDRGVDSAYLAQSAQQIRTQRQDARRDTDSVVIFRLGAEWLALPAGVFQEVCALRPIHSLPHRRNGAVLGIANVRGALLVCVSLHALLGIDKTPAANTAQRRLVHERLLVVGRDGERLVFPVDEIHGIHRFHPDQLGEAPATVARSTATYTRAMLPWQDKAVGVLDDQLLFYSLNKSLA
ncbi:MAG: chemotaxis protein CheW [Chthoniobacter sp.]|uniref:chemotaxis protein CheW n=1 Tax=Chthoniobacter sp. TaxID=2510640 RepID=UPI0032A88A02